LSTHIKILNQHDIKSFEFPPEFSDEGRIAFFDVPEWANESLESLKTSMTKVGFVLQLGYFVAVNKFFATSKFHQKDVKFVAKMLKIPLNIIELNTYEKRSVTRTRSIILEKLGFQKFTNKSKELLMDEALSLCSNQMKPKLMFIWLAELLRQKKIEVPGYYTLSEVITNALKTYEKNLLSLMEDHLNKKTKELLDELLEISEEYLAEIFEKPQI